MADTTPLPIPTNTNSAVSLPQPVAAASASIVADPPAYPPHPYFYPAYPPFLPGQTPPSFPEGQAPPAYPPHPAYMGFYFPPPPGYFPQPPAGLPPGYQPPGFAPPGYAPPGYAPPGYAPSKSPAEIAAAQHNQCLLVVGIIAALSTVHLPWLAYLFAMHGCWGDFFDLCFVGAPNPDADTLNETPFLFARIAFFILRVQSTLAVDFQKFTEVMQVGTGLGSFALTKIVAANGTVVQGRVQRYGLAATCAMAFVVLFWAELTLSSTANYPVLGDETVLSYIDSELPADFVGASEAKAGLMKYLQFLRLADALIFGAALAMPKFSRQDPK